jgi:hypothetical protein
MSNYLGKLMRSVDGDHLRRAFFGALREELLSAARLAPKRPVGRAMTAFAFMGIGAAAALTVIAFVPAARASWLESSSSAAGGLKRVTNGAGSKLRSAVGQTNHKAQPARRNVARNRNGRVRRADQHA